MRGCYQHHHLHHYHHHHTHTHTHTRTQVINTFTHNLSSQELAQRQAAAPSSNIDAALPNGASTLFLASKLGIVDTVVELLRLKASANTGACVRAVADADARVRAGSVSIAVSCACVQ